MMDWITHSPETSRALGAALGQTLATGDLVCLEGDLGAGKTTFVQGLAAGWGSHNQVTSPTFVLINEYHRPNGDRLYHMDAYRLGSAMEAEDLDLDTLLATSPLVVEWADRIRAALPDPAFTIRIEDLDGDDRRFSIEAESTDRLDELMRRLPPDFGKR